MKKFLFILILFTCLLQIQNTVIPHLGKANGLQLPKVRLQLDLPAEKRWIQIAKQFIFPLQTTLGILQYVVDYIPGSEQFLQLFALYIENFYEYQEMVSEVKGVCKGASISFPITMFLNFMYEFTTIKSCSGIVARNSQNQIMHGRNMDFFLWNRFSSLLAEVEIYYKDQYKCSIMSVVGSVFALTGSKPFHFALNEDTRKSKYDQQNFSQVVYNLLVNQYIPSAWLLRVILQEESTWANARQRLIDTSVSAPIYYILSGLKDNEGCVIEKSSVGVHHVYDLSEDTWFLVQSNYDRDVPDPWEDPRRVPVEKRIQKIGQQNFTLQTLYDEVMSKWPTFNIATILTMTSVPSTGYINSTAWYGITPV